MDGMLRPCVIEGVENNPKTWRNFFFIFSNLEETLNVKKICSNSKVLYSLHTPYVRSLSR